MIWRGPFLDLRSGLFVPRLVTSDPETGEFTCVDGPKGFETWEEAEEQTKPPAQRCEVGTPSSAST